MRQFSDVSGLGAGTEALWEQEPRRVLWLSSSVAGEALRSSCYCAMSCFVRTCFRAASNPNAATPLRDFGMNGARSGEHGRPRWTGHDGPVLTIPAARMTASSNRRVPPCRGAVTRRARRPDEHAADLQPIRGRAGAPAGAGAAEQSSDGPGVRTGGVGTNRGEVFDRGVHVGARLGCVAATWRRCSVSASLQAPIAVFRVSAVSGGRAAAAAGVVVSASPSFEAPPSRVVSRGGRVG